MKLHNTNETMLGSQKGSTKFTIATSAKAFKVLSQNLYSNQIRAIIRELSCNAADAHLLAGHTKSFDITLPSAIDPRFIIRDYGPGLSDEDVTHMYTTYFESTKSDSNDFIGALGLGSKSPFGYTETFSIVSRFEGRARGYTACLDNGEPSLIPTFDVEDDSPSGLEVTVPVLEKDVSKWYGEAHYVFATFCDIKPNFIGQQLDVKYLPNKEAFFSESGIAYDKTEVYAIMGKIRYPLKSEHFDFSGIRVLRDYDKKLFVRFKLGELDIAPSREEISYDEETTNNIKTRIKEVTDKLFAEIKKDIDSFDDERALLRYVNNKPYTLSTYITQRFSSEKFGRIAGLVKKYNDFPNLELQGYYICNAPKLVRIGQYKTATKYKKNISSVLNFSVDNLVVIIDDAKGKNKISTIRGMTTDFRVDSLCVVVKDTDTYAIDSINEFMGKDVTLYKLSELRQKYKSVKPAEARPKASNVQVWSLVEDKWNKYFSKRDKFMTASEVREIKGPVLYSFDNSIICSPDNRKYIAERLAVKICEYLDIKEIHVIRPAAYRYCEETNAIDLVSEKIKKAKLTAYSIPVNYSTKFLNGDVIKKLPWIKDLANIKDYKPKINPSQYHELKRVTMYSDPELYDELQKIELQAETIFESNENTIRDKYPVLYYYIFNLPELTSEQVKIINDNLKPKDL